MIRINRLLKAFLITSLVFILYIFTINIVAQTMYFYESSQEVLSEQEISQGFNQEIGFSDKVSVSVTRHRSYGTIKEFQDGGKNINTLSLYNLFNIPLNVNGFNFMILHIIAFILLIYVFYYTGLKEVKSE